MKMTYKEAGKNTWNGFKQAFPILAGVILLVGLANALVPPELYGRIFTGNVIIDPVVGAVLGSVAAGNPITSYIIGGELLKQGVSLLAVTAFIVAWVTVGVLTLPAESLLLGRKFALIRNTLAFLSAIVIAVLTITILNIL